MSQKAIIGWTEHIDLPEWGIVRLKAKVDTGARTSALHVENLIQHEDGTITFDVILHRRKRDVRRHVRTVALRRARVRSSSGDHSDRCFVRTRIRIGYIEREIELSLVSRHAMLFRMLLGRKALEQDFWVDVSRRNLLTRRDDRPLAESKSGRRKRSP